MRPRVAANEPPSLSLSLFLCRRYYSSRVNKERILIRKIHRLYGKEEGVSFVRNEKRDC